MGARGLSLAAPPADQVEADVPAAHAAPLGAYAGRLDLDRLPGRDLTRLELQQLASEIASDPQRWAHLVGFDDDERVYVSLHRDQHVEVWLLCWTPENDTGWHDHDLSSGAVAVVQGELLEHNLGVGPDGGPRTTVLAGSVFSFGADHIHRLTGHAPGSVSVHAYSPPLWRMGQYAVSPEGVLRRVSVSYADELRPLD